jgi:hypothetical protein
MIYTIQKMKHTLSFIDDNKKEVELNGYAFIDKYGHTIVIVYSEGKRDVMAKHLSSDTNELNLKYKIIQL